MWVRKNFLKKYFIKNQGRTNIETEEVLLDSEAVKSIEEKGKMEKPISRKNFIFFLSVIVLAFLILFGKTAYLQIIKGDYYSQLALGNRLKNYSVPAPRGIIYDSNGNPLVYNVSSFDLIVDISDFLANNDQEQKKLLEEVLAVVSGKRGESLSIKSLSEKIEEAGRIAPQLVLLSDIERDKALALKSRLKEFKGLRIEDDPVRKYLDAGYFAHLLGYTGHASKEDLKKKNVVPGERVGKTGLEAYYNEVLRGEKGQKQLEVDSLGRIQKTIASKDPVAGDGLVLSVDSDLQKKIQQSLEKILENISGPGEELKKAAAVALDPRDGSVLALVSLPSFDNNLFVKGISSEKLKVLENDRTQPFLNRVISGQYPPGSLIKPLVAAAALEEDIINPNYGLDCHGRLGVADKYRPGVMHYFNDWKAHGTVDMVEAIAQSCNVYFYTIGGGYEGLQGLGADKISEYLLDFGLGFETDIDLLNEKNGLVPNKSWKKGTKSEDWVLGDTYHLSIGQGDVLVTPLQITTALASLVNGGSLYRPQIVSKIVDSDKKIVERFSSTIKADNVLSSEEASVIKKGMRQAVVSGSAKLLGSLSVKAGGKTGTAQFGYDDKTHAWFSGFAPYENPEIILTILVEAGGEGHDAAVPVAKEVLEWYFK